METTLTQSKPKGLKLFFKGFADLYEKLAPKGYIPPQDVELEESLLGACMIDKPAANKTVQMIGVRTEDDSPFYRDVHTTIYLSMLKLYEKDSIDLMTVKNQLLIDGKLEEIGGPAYLVGLTSKVVTTVNVESYARIILEKYTARETIRICEEIKLRCFEGEQDVFEMVDEATGYFLSLSAGKSAASRPHKAGERVMETIKLIESASERAVPGVSTGFPEWDRYTQGYSLGSQVVIGAETGLGKSALASYSALQAAKRGEGVLIFSSEMKDLEIYLRFIAAETGIPQSKLRGGLQYRDEFERDEKWRQTTKAVGYLAGLPIWIDDTPGLTPLQIRARTRGVIARHPLSIVVVDYLQLLKPTKERSTDARSYGSISEDLRILWSELNVAGILLSQLSRTEMLFDRQGNPLPKRRPHKGRLKESGSIENDAHDIYLLYHPQEHEKDYNNRDKVTVEVIRDKARAGKRGTHELIFYPSLLKFEEPPPQFPEFDNRDGEQIGAF